MRSLGSSGVLYILILIASQENNYGIVSAWRTAALAVVRKDAGSCGLDLRGGRDECNVLYETYQSALLVE